ncbi:MAG: DNA-3-methyladenine glycosylase 2 [Ruminococcaceae bacterium]|nr:DNA-3-methyladenine glycosylase 2 [Oscillospiraceae bacterium]
MSSHTYEKNQISEITVSGVPGVQICGLSDFDVSQIFDCGQCFRFTPKSDDPYHVYGVAFGRYVEFKQNSDTLIIINSDINDYENIWKRYLALDTDYSDIKAELIHNFNLQSDSGVFEKAAECGGGIRLLRQEKWECLCSFIISQNNNIPRIRKIISAMCEKYGKPIEFSGRTYYSFPASQALIDAGIEGLFRLGTGFRAKYIYDAATKIASGEIDLGALSGLDTKQAEIELCKIKGVGPKVAACALLFSLDKYDAFPIDVWVKRILDKYYPGGLDIIKLGKYAGIAQQYLFYYERYMVGK